MGGFVWDFRAPRGQRLKRIDDYEQEQQQETYIHTPLALNPMEGGSQESVPAPDQVPEPETVPAFEGVGGFRQADEETIRQFNNPDPPVEQSVNPFLQAFNKAKDFFSFTGPVSEPGTEINMPSLPDAMPGETYTVPEMVTNPHWVKAEQGKQKVSEPVPSPRPDLLDMPEGSGINFLKPPLQPESEPAQGFIEKAGRVVQDNPFLRALSIASTSNILSRTEQGLLEKAGVPRSPLLVEPDSGFERGLEKASGFAVDTYLGGKLLQKIAPVVGGGAKKAIDLARGLPDPLKITAGAGAAVGGAQAVIGATNPELKEASPFTRAGASFRAGVGDVLTTAGSAAKWQGWDELGESLGQTGQDIKEGYEIQPQEFSWRSFFNPDFYSVNVTRALPLTLSLLPAMYGGYKFGGAAGGKLGLSPFKTAILSAVTGAGLSRPLESAMEAGSTYEDAIARGMDRDKAEEAANAVFKKNLALVGLDAAELATAFAPGLKVASKLGRVALGAGRIGAGALMEAGEEGVQEVFQRQALGDEIAFDPRMKESMAIGGIFGAGMGGAGHAVEVLNHIQERTLQNLPSQMQDQFKQNMESNIKNGAKPEQALERALDAMAETDEGKQIVHNVVQAVSEEINQGQSKIMPYSKYGETYGTMTDKRLMRTGQEGVSGPQTVYDSKGRQFEVLDDASDPSKIKVRGFSSFGPVEETWLGRKQVFDAPPQAPIAPVSAPQVPEGVMPPASETPLQTGAREVAVPGPKPGEPTVLPPHNREPKLPIQESKPVVPSVEPQAIQPIEQEQTPSIPDGVSVIESQPKKPREEQQQEDIQKPNEEISSHNSESVVESKQHIALPVSDFVTEKLKNKESFTSDQLFKATGEAYGGSLAQGKFTPKDAYDAMELGVNKYLGDQQTINPSTANLKEAEQQVKALVEMQNLLPTQTRRTAEMDEFQQFSTPPSIAYVAAWAAHVTGTDTVLEPSAGVGGLAVFGKMSGANVVVNELSPRRAALIKELGFNQVFTENAEQLNNILPANIKPTVVIMNPPFSSTAGRMQGARDTKNATQHIEQALKRLEPGGRLVAIVGRGMADNAPSFKSWWTTIKKEYNVRANIGIEGKNYAKYGTNFGIQIFVIDKNGPTKTDTITGSVTKLEDALPLLEVVRNERTEVTPTNRPVEPATAERAGEEVPQGGQAEAGNGPAVPVSTDQVGAGERGSDGAGRNQQTRQRGPAERGGAAPVLGEAGKDVEPADQRRAGPGEPAGDVDRAEGVREAEKSAGRSGVPDRQVEGGEPGERGTGPESGIKVEEQKTKASKGELTDAVFTEYSPQRLKISGAKPHPGNLAQSAAMAAVDPPAPIYTPNLPKEVIEKGKLSIAQLESIVYAGQAHEQTLPNGQRRGFFVGDGCVAGETRIYDPETGTHSTIKELARIGKPITVLSLTRNGLIKTNASAPFFKGEDDLYKVSLESGRSVIVTPNHKFLTPDGWMRIVDGLAVGHSLASAEGHPASSLGFCPSIHAEDDLHLFGIPEDYLDRCSDASRRYGVQLLQAEDSGQEHAPLQDDAHEHSRFCLQKDDPELLQEYSQDIASRDSAWFQNGSQDQLGIRRFGIPEELGEPSQDQVVSYAFSCIYYSRWDRIVSIGFVRHDKFYDMYVPETENYVAEGIVHHNTGVGKGREISGIILDNMRQGRKKAVWISKNSPLFGDARRDFGDIGGNHNLVFDFSKIKSGAPINQKEGVLFTTYNTLGQGLTASPSRDGLELTVREGQKSRLEQLVKWLGKDFDGVIAFDEAHHMQNSLSMKGKRGMTKPSNMALAGVELQKRLPNARIVYVSATGATEVSNLAYADRLGLWGTGTPFANQRDFVDKISAGGLAAMELVARDMKAMGVYIARSLGFEGVTYGTLEHQLTPEQTEIYDAMATGWQVVLQNISKAMEETGQIKNGNDKGRALAKFWGAQQRFFNQVLTSMQMPAVIQQVRDDITNGKAVVMQLVNTNEATQNRQLAKMEEDESLEDLDLTPRDMLMQYLEKSFPTQQYEEYTDDNGNIRSRPVVDSHGNPVQNRQAVAMKDELMAKLGAMKVPEGPLELVLNTFGVDDVAEITGRGRRVVRVKDESGRTKAVKENRTPKHAAADATAFMEDKKKILIFSDAGGTGRSYHASLTVKNQRQRVHYLIQAGWRADSAVQGFGRTHRTNQANAPHYVLVTTNLKGQKRFISSIARRLDQLGALTKGQRQTGSQGLFSAKDNLESDLARDALQRFYEDLSGNQIPGLNALDLLNKMGLGKLLDDKVSPKEMPEARDITKFLNRILSLESSLQNKVFDAFTERLDRMVDAAIANGTLDVGLENYKADKVKVVDEKTVYTDEKSGAETKYIELDAANKSQKRSFKEASGLSDLIGFYQNTKSSRVYAVRKWKNSTLESGAVVDTYRMYGQLSDNVNNVDKPQFEKGNWKQLDREEGQELWDKAVNELPEYQTQKVHLISGAILPIWDRLPQDRVRVVRVKTDDNRILLGRIIPERAIDLTLKKLGAQRNKQEVSPSQLMDKILKDDYEAYLSNEWKLVKRRVSSENRIELIGKDLYRYMDELQKEGVFTERIQWATRFFIPTGDKAVEVITNVTKYRPVVDLVAPSGKTDSETYAFARPKQTQQATPQRPISINPDQPSRLSPKASREISNILGKQLDTVIRGARLGKSGRKALGFFKRDVGAGKVKRKYLENWRVTGHEIGHAFHFLAGFKPNAAEMKNIVQQFYPGGKAPAGKQTAEGLAEYFMLWFADNAEARNLAPKTTAALEGFLDANPELQKAFDEAQIIAEQDLAGTPLERMRHLTVRRGTRYGPAVGEEYAVPWWKRPLYSLVDYTIPFKDLFKAAAGKGYEGLNPAKVAATSGMAREQAIDLFKSHARDKAGRFLLPGKRSLLEIVEDAAKIPGGVEIMDWVYKAMRYEERAAKGFETPYPPEQIKAAADQARTDYPEIVKLVEEYSEGLSEINLRLLVRGNVISEDTANRVRQGSKFYLPLYTVGRPAVNAEASQRRSSGSGVTRYQGHTGATLDFIEASLMRLSDTALAVEINRLLQTVEETLREDGMGIFGIIEDKPEVVRKMTMGRLKSQLDQFLNNDMDPDDEGRVVSLFMTGNLQDLSKNEPVLVARHGDIQVFMRVAPDIYKSVLSMKPLTFSWVAKALSMVAQVGRIGALANIRFITNSVVRDIVASNIQTQTPERSIVLGFVKGAIAAVGGDKELMSLYISSGAYGSAVQEALDSIRRSGPNSGLISTKAPGWKRTATGLFVRVMHSPLDVLRVFEEAPRIPEFEAVLKKELKSLGLTMDDLRQGNIPDQVAEAVEKALVDAAYASREVLVNFGLHGTNEGFRQYARTVPFLQGGVQGVYRGMRQAVEKPGPTLLRWMMYVLPLTLIAWGLSHKDDRYRDMQSDQRDRYWWFPISDNFFVALAKPYDYALPANMLERFMDWTLNQDDPNRRKPFEDIGGAVEKTFGVPVTSMVLSTIIGLMTNKNYFGSAIEPEREKGLPTELRYGPGNTAAAIKLAELLAKLMGEKAPSPRQIDYFMGNAFGGVGKTAMKGVSQVIPGKYPETQRTGAEYAPIIGPLIYGPGETSSRITDKFYADYDHAQKLYNAGRFTSGVSSKDKDKSKETQLVMGAIKEEKDRRLVQAIPAMRAIAEDLSDLRKELREIGTSPDVTAEQKRVASLRMNWMSKVAAGFLYDQPVPKAPEELRITEADVHDLIRHYEAITQKAMTNARKKPGGPV